MSVARPSIAQQRADAEGLAVSVQCGVEDHATCTGRYVVWIVTTIEDRRPTGYESSWLCRCACHGEPS